MEPIHRCKICDYMDRDHMGVTELHSDQNYVIQEGPNKGFCKDCVGEADDALFLEDNNFLGQQGVAIDDDYKKFTLAPLTERANSNTIRAKEQEDYGLYWSPTKKKK